MWTLDRTAIKSKHMRIAGAGVALAALLAVQGCSSTASTSAYMAPLTGETTADRYRGTSDYKSFARRDALLAARPQAQEFDYASIYSAKQDGDTFVPAFDYTKMNRNFLRKRVRYFGPERPGTIVVDSSRKLLYLVESNGMAMRYGIAVGKEGLNRRPRRLVRAHV